MPAKWVQQEWRSKKRATRNKISGLIVGKVKAWSLWHANIVLVQQETKGASTRGVCGMPTWFESWNLKDTYAALAVVCAAALGVLGVLSQLLVATIGNGNRSCSTNSKSYIGIFTLPAFESCWHATNFASSTTFTTIHPEILFLAALSWAVTFAVPTLASRLSSFSCNTGFWELLGFYLFLATDHYLNLRSAGSSERLTLAYLWQFFSLLFYIYLSTQLKPWCLGFVLFFFW